MIVVAAANFPYNRDMRGIYDYRGEQFAYLDGDKLYDMEGKLAGTIQNNEVRALDGTLVWYRDRDGLYDQHWHSIGYIGSAAGRENND